MVSCLLFSIILLGILSALYFVLYFINWKILVPIYSLLLISFAISNKLSVFTELSLFINTISTFVLLSILYILMSISTFLISALILFPLSTISTPYLFIMQFSILSFSWFSDKLVQYWNFTPFSTMSNSCDIAFSMAAKLSTSCFAKQYLPLIINREKIPRNIIRIFFIYFLPPFL